MICELLPNSTKFTTSFQIFKVVMIIIIIIIIIITIVITIIIIIIVITIIIMLVGQRVCPCISCKKYVRRVKFIEVIPQFSQFQKGLSSSCLNTLLFQLSFSLTFHNLISRVLLKYFEFFTLCLFM